MPPFPGGVFILKIYMSWRETSPGRMYLTGLGLFGEYTDRAVADVLLLGCVTVDKLGCHGNIVGAAARPVL